MSDGPVRVANALAHVDEPCGPWLGDVVVAPPFGVSARNLFWVARVLALNGFRVIRFDARNHVGQAEGSIRGYRLSTLGEDLEAVLDWSNAGLVVGFSLSSSPVVRTLMRRGRLRGAVLIAPVVNVRRTLDAILGTDFFEWAAEDLPETVTVLGEEVAPGGFLDDCREHRYVELEDFLDDVSGLTVPIGLVAGERDPWVRLDEVHAASSRAGAGHRAVVTVEAATHQLSLNPMVAMRYLEAGLRECVALCGGGPAAPVRVPPLKDLIRAHAEGTGA